MRSAQPWQTNRSRVLRSKHTSAEDMLWNALRNRQVRGLKFVRQVPIGPYFADFACRSKKVVIEVDGGTYSTPEEMEADQERTEFLEQQGYQVYRVHNQEIYDNLDGVLNSLIAFLEGRNEEC